MNGAISSKGQITVGVQTLRQADRLLTRDRGFYRNYFKGLSLVEPAE